MSRPYSPQFLSGLNQADDTYRIGYRMAKLCVTARLPAKYVAAAMEVSRATIHNWFRGAVLRGKNEDMALAFTKNFKLAVNYATSRKVEFFDLIDDDTVKTITDMKKLLDTSLNQVINFNNQFQVDIGGDGIEKRETLKTAINQ